MEKTEKTLAEKLAGLTGADALNIYREAEKKYQEAAGIQHQYVPRDYTQPCPSCGHCPTCGRGGYYHRPYYPGPYYYSGTTTVTCSND